MRESTVFARMLFFFFRKVCKVKLQTKIYKNPVFLDSIENHSRWAAEFISYQFGKSKANGRVFNLGTATGSSPELVFAHLIELNRKKRFQPSDGSLVLTQLDNYLLPPRSENGYDLEIFTSLCHPLGLDFSYIRIPPTEGVDKGNLESLKKFDLLIDSEPVDVQLLGLGADGHLAFIPPRQTVSEQLLASFIDEGTRLVALSDETRAINARFFEGNMDAVPRQAVTRGARSILASGWNIVIVNNFKKAMAMHSALAGPVCCEVPASILQLHPRTIWLVAKEAAGTISHWGVEQDIYTDLSLPEDYEGFLEVLSETEGFRWPRY